jgi:hypothetical protein
MSIFCNLGEGSTNFAWSYFLHEREMKWAPGVFSFTFESTILKVNFKGKVKSLNTAMMREFFKNEHMTILKKTQIQTGKS